MHRLLGQRAEQVGPASPLTVDLGQRPERDPIHMGARHVGCWAWGADVAPLNSGNTWEQKFGYLFLCFGSRGKASTETNKMAKAF